MVFGCDPRAPLILGMLGFTREDFGRFVDAHPNDGQFVVIAKIAGEYRYAWVYQKIISHPLFVGLVDIGGDSIFRFKKPLTNEYELPESFVAHFGNYGDAAYAVDFLNRCMDRPIQSTP